MAGGRAAAREAGAGRRRSGIRTRTASSTVSFIRPGVTDNTFTELLRGDLKEGQEVIIGLERADRGRDDADAGRSPEGRMMIMR